MDTSTPDLPSVKRLMGVVEAFGQACKLAGVLEAQGKSRAQVGLDIFEAADQIRGYAARLAVHSEAVSGASARPQITDARIDEINRSIDWAHFNAHRKFARALLAEAQPDHQAQAFGVCASNTARHPCALCGTPYEKHGTYPTCASHSYISGDSE